MGPPSLSVVTPSLDQSAYLNGAMRSVLEPGHPLLEYIVIDGGSRDGSADVIRRYASRLAYWVSEPDDGHYDALNKGFARATGEIMAWLNSSDVYFPWTLATVTEIFRQNPEIEWLTSLHPVRWSPDGLPVNCRSFRQGFSREAFLEGRYAGGRRRDQIQYVQQESTFWRRSLWDRAGGGLDTTWRLAGDFELWARFFEHADLYGVGVPLAANRIHGGQRSSDTAYHEECRRILARYPRPRLATARRLAREARLHEVPLLRRFLWRPLGYEIPTIQGRVERDRLLWRPHRYRKLF